MQICTILRDIFFIALFEQEGDLNELEIDHALTFNLDHSMGSRKEKWRTKTFGGRLIDLGQGGDGE